MSDLIERQAAIDAMIALQNEDIEAYGCAIREGFDGDRATEALRELPSARQWIRCSERLPDKPRLYLIHVAPDEYTNVAYYSGYDWVIDEEEYYFNASDVTHWMPMPEPPKEVET